MSPRYRRLRVAGRNIESLFDMLHLGRTNRRVVFGVLVDQHRPTNRPDDADHTEDVEHQRPAIAIPEVTEQRRDGHGEYGAHQTSRVDDRHQATSLTQRKPLGQHRVHGRICETLWGEMLS